MPIWKRQVMLSAAARGVFEKRGLDVTLVAGRPRCHVIGFTDAGKQGWSPLLLGIAALCEFRHSLSMFILCIFTYSALRGTFLVVNDHDNEGSGMPVQVGMGQSLLLQKSFAGRELPSLPFTMKPASRQVEVMAAITTQRLKAKSVQKGTQRIGPPRKPNAPKKTGTQVLKPPSVGTQVNRKVTSTSTQTCA